MPTKLQIKTRIISTNIKYCPDYDETCAEIDPVRCFLGGIWTCSTTGNKYEIPLANGVCKEMENKRC